jgi:hypothetical protein
LRKLQSNKRSGYCALKGTGISFSSSSPVYIWFPLVFGGKMSKDIHLKAVMMKAGVYFCIQHFGNGTFIPGYLEDFEKNHIWRVT